MLKNLSRNVAFFGELYRVCALNAHGYRSLRRNARFGVMPGTPKPHPESNPPCLSKHDSN
jgi:hypothetical protein